MTVLNLVYGMDPIFKKQAAPVASVDDDVRQTIDDMFDTMYYEEAVGMGANMVGILKQIAVIDLMPGGKKMPLCLVNPKITWTSDDTQTNEEASLCFPFISAEVTRPKSIKVSFLDYQGTEQELEANDFLATVIQHEVDYLNGKIYLDYLSPMKRNMLLKKMQKKMKNHRPHVHGPGCNH